ncbi:MAG: hypothetical protein AB1413_00505 [Thermodesulfobacteriota bacterium]
MKRYKYHVTGDPHTPEIWVCEACKKANGERILLGKWKLIDRREHYDVPCALCAENLTAVNE